MFAGYTVVRLLGAGGVGEVYLVEHPRLPRRDALKVLPGELTAGREYHERFNREADVVANLWHPHIVAVHDRGEFAGQLWMSMDYMEGTDAARLLQDRRGRGLPPADVVRLVTAVADALDYAHERRLLHRDVKPSNILLSQSDTGRQRIMLADFGIARMVGQQLFAHTNSAVVISQHLTAPPPAIADRVPELSGLGPVFSKTLAKKPQDRYGSCSEFADALARNLDSSSLDTGASDATLAAPKARRARPFSDRRRARWALLAVVLVGLLGAAVAVGLIVGNRHRGGTPPQPSPSTPTVPVVLIGAELRHPRIRGRQRIRADGVLRTPASHRRHYVVDLFGPSARTERHTRTGRAGVSARNRGTGSGLRRTDQTEPVEMPRRRPAGQPGRPLVRSRSW